MRSKQFLGQRWMKKLGTFEFCVQSDNRQGNLVSGQGIGNQVDGKSRNRNGQEKSLRLLIWHLETYTKRLDPKVIRKKTGLQECDNSYSDLFLARKKSEA